MTKTLVGTPDPEPQQPFVVATCSTNSSSGTSVTGATGNMTFTWLTQQ